MQQGKDLPPEEIRFAKITVQLSQLIYESVCKLNSLGYKTVNPDMINMVSQLIESFDKKYLIEGFIENSHQLCWDSIKKRDEEFFVKNAGEIFKYLPMDKVDLFKDLFQTKDQNGNCVIEQQLKDNLWRLFEVMVKISIKYVHKGRIPYSYKKGNELISKYSISFYDAVDVSYHANVWNVTLEYPQQ